MVDDGDDDLSGFLLRLATSRAALDGSWVLDFEKVCFEMRAKLNF